MKSILENLNYAIPFILIGLIVFFGGMGLKMRGMGGTLEVHHPIKYEKVLTFFARGYYSGLALTLPTLIVMRAWENSGLIFALYLAVYIYIGFLGVLASRKKVRINQYSFGHGFTDFVLIIFPLLVLSGLSVLELFSVMP